MVTKADIVINAVDQATETLKKVGDSIEDVSNLEGKTSKATEGLRDTTVDYIKQAKAQGMAATEVRDLLGATFEEMQAGGYTVADLTQKVEEQGNALIRMPQYLFGYRGGWVNLISTMVIGTTVFMLVHKGIEMLAEKVMEGAKRWQDYRKEVIETSLSTQEAIGLIEQERQKREEEIQTITTSRDSMREFAQDFKPVIEYYERATVGVASHTEGLKRFDEAMGKVLGQRLDDFLKRGTEAALDQAISVDDLTRKLATLYGVQASEITALEREAIAHMYTTHAMEAQADAVKRVQEATKAAKEAQAEYADRTKDITDQAARAWEDYQFRVQQAEEQSTFRVTQMEEQFRHQVASTIERANISERADAARQALDIEGINRDHYERLADMQAKHQEEMRSELQKAPWYLQREILGYQQERTALEARGDKESLNQLEKNFMERIRAIDPVYAEELEHLKNSQARERDVENREWSERLGDSAARFEIQRRQQQEQLALTLEDQKFSYDQQKEAQEFSQAEQLESMRFAYGQQKEETAKSVQEAQEDLRKALIQRINEIIFWGARATGQSYQDGLQAGRGYVAGFQVGVGALAGITPPAPLAPQAARYLQGGMPYVPTMMSAILHPGEAVLNREEAGAWRGGEAGPVINIQFTGPVYMRTREQISELATEISREIGRRAVLRRG